MTARRIVQWLSNRANPIVVKEARQAVRNRIFIGFYMLLLLVCLIISLVACGSYLEQNNPAAAVGGGIFVAFLVCLAITGTLILPFMAFQGVLSERTDNAYELLNISGITPGVIVRGKFLATMLQLGLICSAFVPFMAFTYFLRGISIPGMLVSIAVTLLASALLVMAGLAAGTLSGTRKSAAVLRIGAIAVVVFVLFPMLLSPAPLFFYGLRHGSSMGMGWGAGSATDFIGSSLAYLLVGASFFILFYLLAVSRLTFATDNRSTPLRVALSLQTLLLSGVFVYFVLHGGGRDVARAYGTMMVIWWAVIGLFATSEPDQLSRRVEASVPRGHRRRFLMTLFWPGPDRGWAFFLAHLGFVLAVTYSLFRMSKFGSRSHSGSLLGDDEYGIPVVLAAYAVIYLGLPSLLFGTVLRRWRTPAVQRVTVLLLVAAALLLPALIEVFLYRDPYRNSWIFSLSPAGLLNHPFNPAAGIVMLLIAGAFVGLHISPIIRGFREMEEIARRRDQRGIPGAPLGSILPHPSAEATENMAEKCAGNGSSDRIN